jgi:hypothetical protein
VKVRLLLVACLSVFFATSCGSAGNAHNDQQASGQSNQFPSGAEFLYVSSPLTSEVYGFHMDTSSGALSPVPGSPVAGPSGTRGRMFLSADRTSFIAVGENAPSAKYSIASNDGSLTRTQTFNFNDDDSSDFWLVAIDASAQFVYGIKGFYFGGNTATLTGIRISDGSTIPGLGMNVRRVVSHPDKHTLYLNGLAYDIDPNTGSLSRSTTISDLPADVGQLTADGLTFVHQEILNQGTNASTHVYHRSSLSSPFSEKSGSPLLTPDPEVPGWYMDPSGTYVYLWDVVSQWYGYRLDTLQPVNSTPFPDFALVDNTGKFAAQVDFIGTGPLLVKHYDSSTGIYGSTIATYSVPPLSNVRFFVGGK